VIFAETELQEAPTASIIGVDTCFRQIEYVGILKGTQNRRMAEAFVDFMLGRTFQEDLPIQMFVFPVNPQATLPDPFIKYAQIPDQPASLPPDEIAENRDRWITEWNQMVLP
jgi:thiamine transport system substrate-binding protein